MSAGDCAVISDAFRQQGWDKPIQQYEKYLQECREGKRDVLVAEVSGDFAGYLTIVWESGYPPFGETGIPEIVDFNVLIKYRRQGIGTALMDAAESRIVEMQVGRRQGRIGGDRPAQVIAGIGVGLTPDYGAAQILYVKRGYVPDGRGAVSHEQTIRYGDSIFVDDSLILYLTKVLQR
jgi:ribosomal protein S18 acetylase RimI-like enzyme